MRYSLPRIQRALAGAVVLAAALGTGPAFAQTATGVPNAVQGFATNRNLPIQIESASLEVRDKDRVATFIDNVRLVQGDTVLECKTLVVHYEGSSMGGATVKPASASTGAGGSGIRKLEAKGGVVVTQKEQTATGNTGLFDMKSNTVTLLGNVVITQGQNVLRGDRLFVDLTSGVSRVEASPSASGQGQRVQGLFLPNANKAPSTTSSISGPPPVVNSGSPATRPPERAKEKPKSTADKKQPMKLN